MSGPKGAGAIAGIGGIPVGEGDGLGDAFGTAVAFFGSGVDAGGTVSGSGAADAIGLGFTVDAFPS